MPNKTPNHKINLPDRGSENWDVALNDNFLIIDGVTKSLSTDGESINIDEELNKAGVLATTSSSLKVYSNLQSAVSDTDGDAEYQLPRGQLRPSQTISLPVSKNKQPIIRGRGVAHDGKNSEGGTFLAFDDLEDGEDGILISGESPSDNARGTQLHDFTVWGVPGTGIVLRYVIRAGTIQNVKVRDASGNGFIFDNNYSLTYYNLMAVGCDGWGHESINGNNETYVGCYSQGDAKSSGGFVASDSDGVSYQGCGAEDHTSGRGIRLLSNVKGAVISGGYFENNKVDIEVNGRDVTIDSPRMLGASSAAIKLDGAQNVTINQPNIEGSTAVLLRNSCNNVTMWMDPNYTVSGDLALYDHYDIRWPNNPNWNGEADVQPDSSTYTAIFNTGFSEKPVINVTQEGSVFKNVMNWQTKTINGAIRYVGAELMFSATPTALTWSAD